MSWISKQLKSVGKVAKKAGKAIGKGWEAIDDYALPAVGFALGGPAGAALGSAAARGIGDGKFNLKATLGAGAKGYALGQLGSMAGLQGGSGFKALGGSLKTAALNPGGTAMNVVKSQVPGMGSVASGGVAPGVANAASAAPSRGLWDGIKKVGSFALDNIDPIMGAASMYQGAKAQGKADDLNKRALALREQQYADFAPIRKLGIAGMQNTQRPDLSAIYRNQQNPFA